MLNHKKKTVVITGAASGLGKSLADEFFRKGYNLALVDIDNTKLQLIQADFLSAEQIVTFYNGDVADEQTVITLRDKILKDHASIDVLINNAAISISQPFDAISLEDYRKLFDTNFWGTVYCTKYFLPTLKRSQNSRLVNVISDFALMGFPGKTAYGSSKSAIMGFTNSLKTECEDAAVKICLVIPPPLDTALVKNGKHVDDDKKKREAEFLKKNAMSISKASQRIVHQIEKGKYRIVVGVMMFWIDLASRLFPTLLHILIRKYKKRFDFI